MGDLSEVQVSQAVTLVDEGRSYRSVANSLGVSKSVVHRVVKRYRQSGSYKRQRGQGRKRATSQQDDRFLKLTALRNRTLTHRSLQAELQRSQGVNVSEFTVSRRLKEQGIRSYRALRAPLLTMEHKRKRRVYTETYGGWTEEDWGKVLFTDECRFCLQPDDKRVRVLRRKKERYAQCNIIGTVQFSGGSIMVWGGITLGGRTVLHIIEGGSLTSQRYVSNILEDIVIPFKPFIGEGFVLMHDNARPHTANRVRAYLEETATEVLEHPPRSPDMNPIEHVWDFLKQKIKKKTNPPRTINELKKAVTEECDNMPQEYVNNLIRSMPRRLETLRRVRGANTRY